MRKILEIVSKADSLFAKKRWRTILLLSIFFCLLIVSRRIDVLTYPGFWAEDGVWWYQEAYESSNPFEPFLIPKQGYFQTVSRLGGFLSQFFDLAYAPLVFNLIAIVIQALPAVFFLSRRFEKVIPSFSGRVAIVLLYIGLLGTAETHTNLTNAHSRLAILMFLIIIAAPTQRLAWKIFDGTFLLLAGLSGPFVFFAFPLAFVYAWMNRFEGLQLRISILSMAFVTQFYAFFFIPTVAARSTAELGASVLSLFKILSRNVFLRPVFGPDTTDVLTDLTIWKEGFLPVGLGVIGLGTLASIFRKCSLEMRLFLLNAFAILAASLMTPQVHVTKPQWPIMEGGTGGRYFLLPRLAWMISLVWLLAMTRFRLLKYMAIGLLGCYITIGIPSDWVIKEFHNYHFERQVNEFKELSSGQEYVFKINPGWKMTLMKK